MINLLNLNDKLDEDFLLKNKIFLYGPIDDKKSNDIIKKLIFLSERGVNEIYIYLNSPGGSITSGLEIFDTIKILKNPIYIIVTGLAASMGAIILNAVKKGRRFLYKNAKVLIHQPLLGGSLTIPATDMSIQADEIVKVRQNLNKILAESTGKTVYDIEKDSDRDKIFSAEEAIEYGLADYII